MRNFARDYALGGVYRGHDEILALLRRIDSEIALSDHRILNIVVERETVAIQRTATVRPHGAAADPSKSHKFPLLESLDVFARQTEPLAFRFF